MVGFLVQTCKYGTRLIRGRDAPGLFAKCNQFPRSHCIAVSIISDGCRRSHRAKVNGNHGQEGGQSVSRFIRPPPLREVKPVFKACPSSISSSLLTARNHTTVLAPVNMHPFAEWGETCLSDSSPSVFGALPSIPIPPILPVFISNSLVLRFSTNSDFLNTVLLGPQNRRLFSTSSFGSRTLFRNLEDVVFAVVDFMPHATVEIQGFTPPQLVKDWLWLTPDQRYDRFPSTPGLPHLNRYQQF